MVTFIQRKKCEHAPSTLARSLVSIQIQILVFFIFTYVCLLYIFVVASTGILYVVSPESLAPKGERTHMSIALTKGKQLGSQGPH